MEVRELECLIRHDFIALANITIFSLLIQVDAATEVFIRNAFSALRSSEGAFNLLEKLRTMDIR